jgi:hypothetical protein
MGHPVKHYVRNGLFDNLPNAIKLKFLILKDIAGNMKLPKNTSVVK